MGLTVTHRFTSTLPDSTNPLLVNASNWNDSHIITGFPFIVVSDYDFTAITPGGSLIVGANVVTLPRVPKGVNGSDQGHLIYISNGTGTPEACLITGGSAVSEGTNQTIIFTCTSVHSGAWTITSATAGWQEAAQDAGPYQTVYFTKGTYNLYGSFTAPFDGQCYYSTNYDQINITTLNGTNLHRYAITGNKKDIKFRGLGFDGNYANQNYIINTINTCIDATGANKLTVEDCKFHAFGDLTGLSYAQVISLYNALDCDISNNLFLSNLAYEININGANTVKVVGNTLGLGNMSQSNTPTNWWDTNSGGFGTICIGGSNIKFTDNRMYGSARLLTSATGSLTHYGSLIGNGGGSVQGNDLTIENNIFKGLGNSRGTVTVSQGGSTITGLNTFFWNQDVGRSIIIEGDGTEYRVTGFTSATQISVTPNIVRTDGSNLRYLYTNSGDVIACAPIDTLKITGNLISDSGDNGIDVSGFGGITNHVIIADNFIRHGQVDGIFLGGGSGYVSVSNNMFVANCRKQVSGHKAAIHLSPTNEGAGAAAVIWHCAFSNNRFIDDTGAGVATQLYGFTADNSFNMMFSNSQVGNTYFVYLGGGALFDPILTQTLQGEIFSQSTITGVQRFTSMAFADINAIDGSTVQNGMIVYCFDAKSISDGVAAGSTAVGGGTGAILHRQNSLWKVGS